MKAHRTIITLALLLLLPTVGSAQYQQENDIPYRDYANAPDSQTAYAQERCKLDVYHPTDRKDAPVVVWFHGGGIEGGSKHIDQELKNSGLVVVAPNYRLLPKATIDDVLDDAAAAVAWTYKNIERYGGSHRNNIRKQQNIGPLQPTIDRYAPLTYVRPDAPPMVIISGDRELELYGRYEEQAYFWRMLKLVGHNDVTLYEMQGYDHGSMPHPAYKILKDHIRRITVKMTSPLPAPAIKTPQQAEYCFRWQPEYLRRSATIDHAEPAVLHLGASNGYYDLTAETGALVSQLRDFTVSVHFKVSAENQLDGYGHFLFAFSQLAENSAHEGPYMAMRLNEQRFETSTGGYEHEQIIMQGGKPRRDVWVHALYRQQGHKGELFLDGKLIGRNDNMPILADIFSEAPANCWIGRAPFRGDKYLTQTDVADFRIYNYAVSNQELRQLRQRARQ